MKNVIFVESPTKAKTLDRFFKGKFDIVASMGHIRDLPKSKLGVDIDDNFTPQYIVPRDKGKLAKVLRSKVKSVDKVILATDPDREGEAIAFHLHELLKDKVKKGTSFSRIVFHEITKDAIEHALSNPREIDQDLVNAQTARRILDRIVGYKLSPLLWKKVKSHLSAGRVQSVALRLIVERESEIEKFQKETFYRIFTTLSTKAGNTPIEFELIKIDDKKIEESKSLSLYDGEYNYRITVLDKKNADSLVKNLDKKNFEVIDIKEKESKRSPYPPFSTSTLQQAAFRRFSYTGKRTMSLAQKLYEEGYITYHRTDSFNLSSSFLKSSREYIKKEFGDKFLSPNQRVFKTKSKSAQEAHEAIRPTEVDRNIKDIKSKLGADYAKLYDLIFRRATATQMADAVYYSTKIEVETKNNGSYIFGTSGRIIKFPGFLKLYSVKEEEGRILPEVRLHEILKYIRGETSEHLTSPPPRYNEASLVSSLEKHGIGRPSTYAPIISTLIDRFYVEKIEGRLVPTKVGKAVTDFLVKNFSDIDDIPFTAGIEEKLDKVAAGKLEWVTTLREFYGPFEKDLEKGERAKRIDIEPDYVGRKCPDCKDGQLVIKHSKFGKFLACSNFPDCKYKESYVVETEFECPKDKGKIVVKKTRRGRDFFGCSNYPKCEFAVWKKQDLVKQLEENSTSPQNN